MRLVTRTNVRIQRYVQNDALSPPAFVIVASFNNLLDALDGSYCTFEGGDDPEYDAMYPDPSGNGYEGKIISASRHPNLRSR